MLNTISELVGTAIRRTRLQQPVSSEALPNESNFSRISDSVINPNLEAILTSLEGSKSDNEKIKEVLTKVKDFQDELSTIQKETKSVKENSKSLEELNYPQMLTKREHQVLALIKEGLTNEQIGNQLFIAERTVKFHISSILSKLHANNRTEAVDIALKRGLFSL